MRIRVLQHVPFEGPGFIADWASEREHILTVSHLYRGDGPDEGEPPDLLVVMGGPMSVYEEAAYPWMPGEKRLLKRHIGAGGFALGVCLGAQLLAEVLGGAVRQNDKREIGWFDVLLRDDADASALFTGFPGRFEALHWHGDAFAIPPGALHVARSAGCATQAFDWSGRVAGVQFHLESTPDSLRLLCENDSGWKQPGTYVQTESVMRAHPDRFDGTHRLMRLLLDRLEEAIRASD